MNPLKVEDLGLIQGDILLNGFPKKAEIFCFFTIRAAKGFCDNLQKVANSNIATGSDIKNLRERIEKKKQEASKKGLNVEPEIIDEAKTNIAFTSKGLAKLANIQPKLQASLSGLKGSAPSFLAGMQEESERTALGDPVFKDWPGNQNGGGSLDGVLIVAGVKMSTVEAELDKVLRMLKGVDQVVAELGREVGMEREKEPHHEHFGFNDGISHPQVFGINDSPSLTFKIDGVIQPDDTSNFVDPGVIVVGRKGDHESAGQALTGVMVQPKPQWMKDGSFLVIRKLEQHVRKWNDFVSKNWKTAGSQNADHFGAQLMGRWKSGCPIQLQNVEDDPRLALRNNFDYGGMSKDGVCPFAAHIRKAHIRIGLKASRIMRRGIPYGEDLQPGGKDEGRGLLFAAYQSTIEDGYKFIQTAWANDPNFPVKNKSGFDVTIGQGKGSLAPFTIGTKSVGVNPANEFVTTMGGEYFFAPSINVLRAGFNLDNLDNPKAGQPKL